MLKILAWIEIASGVALLALTAWPFTAWCSGRWMGLDSESRAIFAVNLFGPAGLLMLVCGTWTLNTRSVVSQYVLALGVSALIAWWVWNVF